MKVWSRPILSFPSDPIGVMVVWMQEGGGPIQLGTSTLKRPDHLLDHLVEEDVSNLGFIV